ncbi:MAG: hypothetical protein IPH45_19665, partial [Bacteroidales bacterium]|nr:hypothetical protein [Bacteroidales bacterium]
ASSGSGYAAISWSSSGTGTFDNVSLLHPVYSPSAADILAGSVTLTLTATAFSSCANTVSNMTLIITRQVDVNAGIDETICQNAVFVPTSAGVHFQSGILWTHNGTGTLTGASTQFPTYTPGPGETGTIQLTMTAYAISPCIDASDQMNLTINPPASANAGSNSTICEGSSYTLSSSSASGYTSLLWSSAGTGTFNDATILTPPIPLVLLIFWQDQ